MINTPPWFELERRHIYERFGRGIDEVTYLISSGQEAVFAIQTQRPTVAVLALTPDNMAIVTRQFRPGPGKTVYELPGGYLDGNEDPTTAGIRELKEETGFTSTELVLAGACYADSYSTGKKYAVLATNCTQVTVPSLDREEFIAVNMTSIEDLQQLAIAGELLDIDLLFLALNAFNRSP